MTQKKHQPKTQPRTVLIVEDSPLVAKFYRMALERAGDFACVVTEDVSKMLAEVESGRVHVVVLDVSLSGTEWQGRPIDGVELSRLLKQHAETHTGRPLPILLATAHALAGDRERLLAASGADDYLEKPVFDPAQLVGKILSLLGSA
jgi:two-component system cell cycle response regulator DivK